METEVQKCFCGDSNYGQQGFHGVKEVLGQNRRVGEGTWMDGWMDGREGGRERLLSGQIKAE